MIPTQIERYVVNIDTPAVYAYYIVRTSILYPLALVCDSDDRLVGVISGGNLNRFVVDITHKKCGDICNRDLSYIKDLSEDAIYSAARNIFAEKELATLPVVDDDGIPIRMFGRFQAFFRKQYLSLPYSHYAQGLMEAAELAKSRGYERMSVIEFGVASGRGLICMEIFAREVQRLTGVVIDVYGFDVGIGYLPPADYRDCPQSWIEGDYKMDIDLLNKKLYSAKLVMGDICKTTKTFFKDYSPAPIGFVALDIGQYTPTVAILDMFFNDDEHFLPIVRMYFCDIGDQREFQGETLAVREFNAKSKDVKISPEHAWKKIRWCHRFNHFKYAAVRKNNNVVTNIV
jgi:hypothetical protein